MGKYYFYIYDRIEKSDLEPHLEDGYIIDVWPNSDFSTIHGRQRVPTVWIPTWAEVGDLIVSSGTLSVRRLRQSETEKAPDHLKEKLEYMYADHERRLREYADRFGVDIDDFPDYVKYPDRDIPKQYYYINRKEDDEYLVHSLKQFTLPSFVFG